MLAHELHPLHPPSQSIPSPIFSHLLTQPPILHSFHAHPLPRPLSCWAPSLLSASWLSLRVRSWCWCTSGTLWLAALTHTTGELKFGASSSAFKYAQGTSDGGIGQHQSDTFHLCVPLEKRVLGKKWAGLNHLRT